MENYLHDLQRIRNERYLSRRFTLVFGHDTFQRCLFWYLWYIQGETWLTLSKILCQLWGNSDQHVSSITYSNSHTKAHDDFRPFIQVPRVRRLRKTNLQKRKDKGLLSRRKHHTFWKYHGWNDVHSFWSDIHPTKKYLGLLFFTLIFYIFTLENLQFFCINLHWLFFL